MLLTRRYHFSASHRLHSGALTESENQELYGKCNNPYGHGHNYVLEVSVRGSIDGRTGRVTNPANLDRYIRECILDIYDHKDLNEDVPDFRELVPTTENLARAIRTRLEDGWDQRVPGTVLARVRMEETPRNTFEA